MTLAKNVGRLATIASLVPDQEIRTENFERRYPTPAHDQADIDEFIADLLSWYLSSVKAKQKEIEGKEREITGKEREIEACAKLVEEKDSRLKDKDHEIKAMETLYDGRLKDKDHEIEFLQAESRDAVGALKDVALKDNVKGRKWSTTTRSEAWHDLERSERANLLPGLSEQQHDKKSTLVSTFGQLTTAQWKEEKHMYPKIIDAMQTAFYNEPSSPKVVDTHDSKDFRGDVTISDYDDKKVAYCLWYYIEFKYLTIELITPDHCGQMLDYFHAAHERQPHRREFVGILSNFGSAWVFTARFEGESVVVTHARAPSLVDAIIYADRESRVQYTTRIPPIDPRLLPGFKVVAVGKHHFILEAVPSKEEIARTKVKLGREEAKTSKRVTRAQDTASRKEDGWREPVRHSYDGRVRKFILKTGNGSTSRTVMGEIEMLRKMRESDCKNLPELVWEAGEGKEFGIAPAGRNINFREPRKVSRKLVWGLLDGLQWLHSQSIIHRDIRPSNFVVDGLDNLVIVDYETAVVRVEGQAVEYKGGFICWPKRLIMANQEKYVPEPEDDLYASILAVSQIVFPERYEGFRVSSIRLQGNGDNSSRETKRLLKLWEDVERSTIWGPFANAAGERDYEKLKKMGDIFWYV